MKNKKFENAVILVQIALGIAIISFFVVSLTYEIFINPVRLLAALLFFTMAYNYQTVLNDKIRKYTYVLFGILLLLAFIAGLNG